MLAHQEDRLPSANERYDQPAHREDHRGDSNAHMRYTDKHYDPKRPYLRLHPDCQDLFDSLTRYDIEVAIDVTPTQTRLQVDTEDFYDAMSIIRDWGNRDYRGIYCRRKRFRNLREERLS